jgi:hypothetical protein
VSDFSIVNIPEVMSQKVSSYDREDHAIRDDGEWHRQVAESQYVLAEFLVSKGLVTGKNSISRTPDLVIQWSQLTDIGQAFMKAALDKWLMSVDRVGTTEAAKVEKLERRWRKFTSAQS